MSKPNYGIGVQVKRVFYWVSATVAIGVIISVVVQVLS